MNEWVAGMSKAASGHERQLTLAGRIVDRAGEQECCSGSRSGSGRRRGEGEGKEERRSRGGEGNAFPAFAASPIGHIMRDRGFNVTAQPDPEREGKGGLSTKTL